MQLELTVWSVQVNRTPLAPTALHKRYFTRLVVDEPKRKKKKKNAVLSLATLKSSEKIQLGFTTTSPVLAAISLSADRN